MACACKATEQISYIQKKYGINQPKQKRTHIIPENPWGLAKDIVVFLIVVAFSPVMLIYTFIHSFVKPGKPINIAKLFSLGKQNKAYVREQQ